MAIQLRDELLGELGADSLRRGQRRARLPGHRMEGEISSVGALGRFRHGLQPVRAWAAEAQSLLKAF